MKIYQALAQAFIKEGVTDVFGLMGDGNMHWWSELSQRPEVTFHHARHEGPALSMAEGWARIAGRPGVCSVTMGPGLSQLATALIVACRGNVPLVVFAGAAADGDEGALQYLNQEQFVAATGAGFVSGVMPAGPDEAVRQAFYRAHTESRPVVLNVPIDYQQREFDGDIDEYEPAATRLPAMQRIQPDPDRVREAVAIIASSTKPVIVAGTGAFSSGAGEAIARLAERIGALVATSLPAKGNLGQDEFDAGVAGLFSTRTTVELFSEADCVIGVGASLNHYTIEGGYLFPSARYIHIDRKPHQLMGNRRTADCYMQGDAKLSMELLDRTLADQGVSSIGYRTPEVRTRLQAAGKDPGEFEIEPGTVDPRDVADLIDKLLPEEIGLIFGVAHYWGTPIIRMKKQRAAQVYTSAFGSIGQGLPTAIGAAVALGDRPVVVLDGDASTIMHIQELDTAVRDRLKLLAIVMNDEALGAEYHKMRAKGFDPTPATIRSPDLAAVARGFGCRGQMARTLEEVSAGIREFLAGEGPMLLDVRISRNVPSVAYRRLHYGEDV